MAVLLPSQEILGTFGRKGNKATKRWNSRKREDEKSRGTLSVDRRLLIEDPCNIFPPPVFRGSSRPAVDDFLFVPPLLVTSVTVWKVCYAPHNLVFQEMLSPKPRRRRILNLLRRIIQAQS